MDPPMAVWSQMTSLPAVARRRRARDSSRDVPFVLYGDKGAAATRAITREACLEMSTFAETGKLQRRRSWLTLNCAAGGCGRAARHSGTACRCARSHQHATIQVLDSNCRTHAGSCIAARSARRRRRRSCRRRRRPVSPGLGMGGCVAGSERPLFIIHLREITDNVALGRQRILLLQLVDQTH